LAGVSEFQGTAVDPEQDGVAAWRRGRRGRKDVEVQAVFALFGRRVVEHYHRDVAGGCGDWGVLVRVESESESEEREYVVEWKKRDGGRRGRTTQRHETARGENREVDRRLDNPIQSKPT
jgi:hypothetical protein